MPQRFAQAGVDQCDARASNAVDFSGTSRSTVPLKSKRSSTNDFERYGAAADNTRHLKYAFQTGSGVEVSNWPKPVK